MERYHYDRTPPYMKLSENIRSHQRFETDRGIYDYYTIPETIRRTKDELDEALVELVILENLEKTVGSMADERREALEKLLREMLDTWNMIGTVVLHIINELGVAPEQVDTMMTLINKSRDAKYAVEYFRSMPIEEAIKVSRDTWAMRRNGHY